MRVALARHGVGRGSSPRIGKAQDTRSQELGIVVLERIIVVVLVVGVGVEMVWGS